MTGSRLGLPPFEHDYDNAAMPGAFVTWSEAGRQVTLTTVGTGQPATANGSISGIAADTRAAPRRPKRQNDHRDPIGLITGLYASGQTFSLLDAHARSLGGCRAMAHARDGDPRSGAYGCN
jgi:hypothetical protein